MDLDFSTPAELKWHLDEEEPPEDWWDAISFPTLREALGAVVHGTPQTGHPWIRCEGRVVGPQEVETLIREDGTD